MAREQPDRAGVFPAPPGLGFIPPGHPVRMRVLPRDPDFIGPVPRVPPLRNRAPTDLRTVLEDIRHDQRQVRLTLNVMVETVNALASQVEELYQKFA